MGRVRLSVKRLESHSNRQSTYCKRRCGILKKAQEISVLCDIDIILLLFSPNGKPTLFQGGQSNFDEIIAKFAQLTPQERAKRKLESLETLRKTFKKLDNDIGVPEFLDASDPSVEELHSQVKLLQSRLTDVEMRLNWWSNPDNINKVEDFALMECALRESLNAVHVRKLQKTTHLHLLMNSELDGILISGIQKIKSCACHSLRLQTFYPRKIWDTLEIIQLLNLLMFRALEKLIKQDRTQLQC